MYLHYLYDNYRTHIRNHEIKAKDLERTIKCITDLHAFFLNVQNCIDTYMAASQDLTKFMYLISTIFTTFHSKFSVIIY